MKSEKIKKAFLKLTVLLIVIFFSGCAEHDAFTTSEQTVPQEYTGSDETDTVAETKEISDNPVGVKSFFIGDGYACITGFVNSGAYVTAYTDDCTVTEPAQEKLFYIQVPAGKTYSLTATEAGKAESVAVSIDTPANGDETNFYVGHNSQLFLKEHIADYTRISEFTKSQQSYLTRITENNIKKLKDISSDDVKLIYLIIPDPQCIYPEWAPDYINNGMTDGESKPAQFCRAVAGIDGVYALDMTDTLTNGKSLGTMIRQTDTHWTELAGFLAYEQLHKIIAADNPQIKTYSLSDFTEVTLESVAGNYITDKTGVYESETYLHPGFEYKNDLYTLMSADTIQNLHIRTAYEVTGGGEDYPTALFVRDSFSTNIMKYMAEDFSYMYMQIMWEHKIDFDKAEEIKPDYVIHLLLEHNLPELLNQ